MFENINELLDIARSKGASDLHITVGVPPKIRVDGVLESIGEERVMPEDSERLIMEIIPERLRESFADKGEVDFSHAMTGVGRFRVNVFRQRGSVACVIRLVAVDIPSAEELGLPDSVSELAYKKKGLVIVTGPTGCGKSTTLASLIDVVNTNLNKHVITLEDPIEYLHRHKKSIVNQREIGIDSNSYSDALRAALREDPDVILVGEMRDLDTIATAITAAETGHLVLSTLHTTGAANTIDRIIDVFPAHQQQQIRIQLSSVLESVVSQLLLPKTEGHRVAAFEVMHSNPAIRNLIREGKTHQIDTIIQTNRKNGMITMDDAIYELYTTGQITAESAVSYAQDPAVMARKCGV